MKIPFLDLCIIRQSTFDDLGRNRDSYRTSYNDLVIRNTNIAKIRSTKDAAIQNRVARLNQLKTLRISSPKMAPTKRKQYNTDLDALISDLVELTRIS